MLFLRRGRIRGLLQILYELHGKGKAFHGIIPTGDEHGKSDELSN